MRVAIVHDYLTQRGGAERVVLSMTRAFPQAPVYTSLYEPAATFPEFGGVDVRPSPLNRVSSFRANHRLALPLYAPLFSSMRIDADVVLCSSSGWAHGVRTPGRKVVYCYNPARWLYQLDAYAPARSVARQAGRALGAPLRWWDRRAAAGAASYLTSSRIVADRIRAAYGRDAEVLPPPPALAPEGQATPVGGVVPGFSLCVSRLLPYKNVGAVIAAFAGLPGERLVVVGDGPELAWLAAEAPPNATLIGGATDEELRWLYRECDLLVAASYEDYGLTPLEAASFGKPSVVLKWGGFLDTMTDTTAAFFTEPTPRAIAWAISHARDRAWDAEAIRRHAATFDGTHFEQRLRDAVEGATQ